MAKHGPVASINRPTPHGTPARKVAVGTAVAETTPNVGWALLTAPAKPAFTVLCELGDQVPLPNDGYGGFETVDKEHDLALTKWAGFKPLQVELPLLLDNFADGKSIDDAVQLLEAMAGRGKRREGLSRGEYVKPQPLIVNTAGVWQNDAHNDPGGRWVINNLTWDAETITVNDHGNWIRAGVTVTLLQIHEPTGVAAALAAARKRTGSPGGRVTYTTKAGDTLVSIARKKLGDAGRWTDLAKLNPTIRDPRRTIHTNTKIRLPG